MITRITPFAVALGLLSVSFGQAQQRPSNPPSFITRQPDEPGRPLREAPRVLRERLALTDDEQLTRISTEDDAYGFVHEKYQQYYRGVKVDLATYAVHARNGIIETLNGNFRHISGVDPAPAVSEVAALQQALTAVGARRYQWQEPALEGVPGSDKAPRGELVILSGNDQLAPSLAWKFVVNATEPRRNEWVYVNAHTGKIASRVDLRQHANSPGTFETYYSGTQPVITSTGLETPNYRLRELPAATGERHIVTLTQAGQDFWDDDNTWKAAEHPNDLIAGDVHWGMRVAYDYFWAHHNRKSFDGQGAALVGRVHGPGGTLWNGLYLEVLDGNAQYGPEASLDVIGHEVGHAVCQYAVPGLGFMNQDPNWLESRALNEGIADIWGACVKAYGGQPQDMYHFLGRAAYSVADTRPMDDPNSVQRPDTYKGSYYQVGGDEHNNGMVIGHWFYLLSEGGSGTNEFGTAYSVNGLGHDLAAKLTYRMLTQYMTATSTYPDARKASVRAAIDLFGICSSQVTAVREAWNAVGVFDAEAAINNNSTPLYSGGGVISGTTISFTGNGIYPNYRWTASGAGVVSSPASPASGPTFSARPMQQGTLYVTCENYDNANTCALTTTFVISSVQISICCREVAKTSEDGGLYPNPTAGAATIALAEAPAAPVPATVYNGQGKPVKTFQLTKANNAVDLHGLLPGLYYLRYTRNGQPHSQAFRIE